MGVRNRYPIRAKTHHALLGCFKVHSASYLMSKQRGVPVADDAVLGAQRPVYSTGGACAEAQSRLAIMLIQPCWGLFTRPWQVARVSGCSPAREPTLYQLTQ